MKNLKLIILTSLAVLFIGMAKISAQESSSKMVFIRAIEYPGGNNSGMTVVDPENKTYSINLEKGPDYSGNNAVLIKKEIEKWKQEGYKLTQLSVSGETVFHTTIILEK